MCRLKVTCSLHKYQQCTAALVTIASYGLVTFEHLICCVGMHILACMCRLGDKAVPLEVRAVFVANGSNGLVICWICCVGLHV